MNRSFAGLASVAVEERDPVHLLPPDLGRRNPIGRSCSEWRSNCRRFVPAVALIAVIKPRLPNLRLVVVEFDCQVRVATSGQTKRLPRARVSGYRGPGRGPRAELSGLSKERATNSREWLGT